jgi:hypothetical protein
MGWNPRYLAYCYSNGQTDPDEMLRIDQERWPGGIMGGFILWSNDQLFLFRKEHPEAFLSDRLFDHQAYDKWLDKIFKK